MEVILVFRHLSSLEEKEIEHLQNEGAIVVSAPGFFHSSKQGILNFPDSVVKEATEELIDAIKNFGDKVVGDSRISSILTIGNMPLWHYQRFRIFFLLKNQWLIKKAISHYLVSSHKVTCYAVNKTTYEIYDNRVSIIKPKSTSSKKVRNYKAIFNYLLFFKLRVIISIFRKLNLKEKKHAIIDRSLRQQCRNIVTLEKKWDNFNLYPLFDLNLPDFLIISEIETPKFNNEKPFSLHSYYFNGEGRTKNTIYGEWILFKGLISVSTFTKLSTLKKQYQESVAAIQKLKLTTTEKRIFDAFTSLEKSSNFYLLKYLCYSRFFSKNKIENISAIDENSPATKCILDSARENGAQSIGIQHGNIGDSQPAYLYTSNDKIDKVMADKTIVWGKYWSDFLINFGNFPAESIKIAGQMRSDVIPAMLERSSIYKESIEKSDFIAVFASQPIPDPAMRRKLAHDVFSCFSNIESTLLIVKLHPAERYSAAYYENIAIEVGCKNYKIIYDVDLYELLAACDIVITAYSTVGSEAVYFGKPLIIHDPYNEDLLGYIKEGVAMQAVDNESMINIVENIKSGKIKPDMSKYLDFISKYAYAIDGKATERTLKVISPEVYGVHH